MATALTDIVVAVHGIGQQIRYSTVRYVATRVAASRLSKDGKYPPLAVQPLGYFHQLTKGPSSVVAVDDAKYLTPELSGVGLAEVFWANIPDKIVKQRDTLEETKAWGRTVVARAAAMWDRGGRAGAITPDFSLASEVLDEIIETVYVLENLLFLTEKAGLFKFDLREVLEAYLGDVQLVAEFASVRREIVLQFHRTMQHVYDEERRKGNGNVRLHVVAHSEGTVVSFLGLLQALSGMRVRQLAATSDKDPAFELYQSGGVPDWVRHVHGYMTIGSPIDKHLLLWPEMWKEVSPALANAHLEPGQIKWRNYYDYGDPVGFKLDTAREQLAKWNLRAFEFGPEHDHGFARYLLPGKAHNDYWEDPEVFEHFVSEARIGETAGGKAPPADADRPEPPTTKRLIYVVSPTLPYVLSFLLLFLGVFVLDKAVIDFIYPWGDPLIRHLLISEIGVDPTAVLDPVHVFRNTLGIAALIVGATLLARFPRLAAGKRWLGYGLLAFLAGCAVYALVVPQVSQKDIGSIFPEWGGCGPTIGVCLVAFVVGVIGLLGVKRNRDPRHDRRQRWVRRGMRPLILVGALAVFLIVLTQMFPDSDLTTAERAKLTPEQLDIVVRADFDRPELDQLFAANRLENLPRVEGVLTLQPPAWPVVLAGGLFLYLWWLATLIFDLSFVWERYVRGNVAHDRLKEWARGASREETARTADAR